MDSSNEQSQGIRQFLLGQLDKAADELVEDRIFADQDFAEEVRILESELIAEYREGHLSHHERRLFEEKYFNTPAGIWEVKYDSALTEFARYMLAEKKTLAATAAGEGGTVQGAEETPHKPREQRLEQPQGFVARVASLVQHRPVFAGAMIVLCLLLTGVLGYMALKSPEGTNGRDSLRANRRMANEDLARLNSGAALPSSGREIASADLTPAQRSQSHMQRVAIGGANPYDVLKLRLNLTQAGGALYRALVRDEHGNELFTVPDLSPRDTPDGPQIWLLIYARYLKDGDYQIDLNRSDSGGEYHQYGTYAFRVIDHNDEAR